MKYQISKQEREIQICQKQINENVENVEMLFLKLLKNHQVIQQTKKNQTKTSLSISQKGERGGGRG